MAEFELAAGGDDAVTRARAVYERADQVLKEREARDEVSPVCNVHQALAKLGSQRYILYESWQEFEKKTGNDETRKTISERMPKKVKKRRKMVSEDGVCFLSFSTRAIS